MGRIPQSFIDDLLSRVDIVDIIDHRVPLKKAGREYKACCPFHSEKTPSFTVSQQKQFYHCFGCGAHGSAISFLMDYDNLSFPEAIEELAGQAGMEVPKEQTQDSKPKTTPQYYELTEAATRYFRAQLKHNQRAIDYLKNRGLTGQTAADFELGYAPDGWHNLEKQLGSNAQSKAQMEKVGLLIRRDNGEMYDRFRDRVMFPIRDRRGRVIGFGGRVIDQGEPKYLNSPETPIFHKGEELYGLYQARQADRNLQRLLVVEGYMDVVSLAQHGIHYAVATLGTAITEQHLNLLMRHTDEVVFCFDGDRAGRQAAWRAVETALPKLSQGLQLKFLFLPEGEDPDTMIQQKGKGHFEELVQTSQQFSQFFFESLSRQADIRGLDGQAKLLQKARPLLNSISDEAVRQLMTARLAEHINMPPMQLTALLENRAGKPQQPERRKNIAPPTAGSNKQPSLMRSAICQLLHQPSLASLAGDINRFDQLELSGARLFQQLLELLTKCPNINTGAILEHWRGTKEGIQLSKLASMEHLVPEESAETVFADTLNQLERLAREQELEKLFQKSRYGRLSPEEKQRLSELLHLK